MGVKSAQEQLHILILTLEAGPPCSPAPQTVRGLASQLLGILAWKPAGGTDPVGATDPTGLPGVTGPILRVQLWAVALWPLFGVPGLPGIC